MEEARGNSVSFYVLKPDGGLFGRRWAYGEIVEPSNSGPPDRCPQCGAPVSRLKWLPPHRLTLSTSRREKWPDMLWGAGFPLMVSARFREAYEAAGLQGITCFHAPAEILRMGSKRVGEGVPAYHLIDILWGGANLDDRASGAVRENVTCPYDRGSIAFLQKVVLEDSSWVGADIFEARGLPARIVVSERSRDAVDAFRLTGAMLIPAERYAYDDTRPGRWYVRDD